MWVSPSGCTCLCVHACVCVCVCVCVCAARWGGLSAARDGNTVASPGGDEAVEDTPIVCQLIAKWVSSGEIRDHTFTERTFRGAENVLMSGWNATEEFHRKICLYIFTGLIRMPEYDVNDPAALPSLEFIRALFARFCQQLHDDERKALRNILCVFTPYPQPPAAAHVSRACHHRTTTGCCPTSRARLQPANLQPATPRRTPHATSSPQHCTTLHGTTRVAHLCLLCRTTCKVLDVQALPSRAGT